MNCLRDRWERDLNPDELVIDRENVSVFDGSSGNLVRNTLKFISEKTVEMKGLILIKTEMR